MTQDARTNGQSVKTAWQLALGSAGLGVGPTAVGLRMSLHAKADGSDVYPSADDVAQLGTTRKSVCHWRRELVEAGWLTQVSDAKPGKRARVYRLTIPSGSSGPAAPGPLDPPYGSSRPAAMGPEDPLLRVPGTHKHDSEHDTEHVIQHDSEHDTTPTALRSADPSAMPDFVRADHVAPAAESDDAAAELIERIGRATDLGEVQRLWQDHQDLFRKPAVQAAARAKAEDLES